LYYLYLQKTIRNGSKSVEMMIRKRVPPLVKNCTTLDLSEDLRRNAISTQVILPIPKNLGRMRGRDPPNNKRKIPIAGVH